MTREHADDRARQTWEGRVAHGGWFRVPGCRPLVGRLALVACLCWSPGWTLRDRILSKTTAVFRDYFVGKGRRMNDGIPFGSWTGAPLAASAPARQGRWNPWVSSPLLLCPPRFPTSWDDPPIQLVMVLQRRGLPLLLPSKYPYPPLRPFNLYRALPSARRKETTNYLTARKVPHARILCTTYK